jgi:hypothetical protein
MGQTKCKTCPPKYNTSTSGQALCTPNLIPTLSFQDLDGATPVIDMTVVLAMNPEAFDSAAQNLFRLAISEAAGGVAGEKVHLLEISDFRPKSRRQGSTASTEIRLAVEADSEDHATSMLPLLNQVWS